MSGLGREKKEGRERWGGRQVFLYGLVWYVCGVGGWMLLLNSLLCIRDALFDDLTSSHHTALFFALGGRDEAR